MSKSMSMLLLLLATAVAVADEPAGSTEAEQAETAADQAAGDEAGGENPAAAPAAQQGPKMVSGMSILGNQEAPKSLVIVPWKSSEIGDSLAISTLLDDSRQPVDREVFLRALIYYEIRSSHTP